VVRRKLIAGNWKMHMTPRETEAFLESFLARVIDPRAEVLLIPPFTSLDRAARRLTDSPILLGAQDIHQEPRGAFTGAISSEMVRDIGCTYVLVGHSERRHVFGDDDATVRQKLQAALAAGLQPILCVGEVLDERRSGETQTVIAGQLSAGLTGITPEEMERITIAYEPVWAIGTGETATPEQAQDAIAGIRQWLADRFAVDAASSTRILYGGSVKPGNAADLVHQPDIDGALVGGASLDPELFAQIVAAGEEAP
jgi:triosephosphate isomerase